MANKNVTTLAVTESKNNWALSRAAQEATYKIGDTVHFITVISGKPHLSKGTVRAIQMLFGHGNSEQKDCSPDLHVHFKYLVWNDDARCLATYEADEIFRTKQKALWNIAANS